MLVTGLVQALLALAVSFGLDLTQGQMAAVVSPSGTEWRMTIRA